MRTHLIRTSILPALTLAALAMPSNRADAASQRCRGQSDLRHRSDGDRGQQASRGGVEARRPVLRDQGVVPLPCTIQIGKEDEVGAVRSVAAEIMVSKTELSYTYTQAPREGRPYNLYHGTLEARPLTATTSKLVYTLFFDNSMLPDQAAKDKDRAGKVATFTRALENMKLLAEGGTLPPPAPKPAARQ